MNVLIDGGIYVTLSERNVRDLLAQFEAGDVGAGLHRWTDNGMLSVGIEANEVHYKDRDPGPGGRPPENQDA
jgi:hypothetical protein